MISVDILDSDATLADFATEAFVTEYRHASKNTC